MSPKKRRVPAFINPQSYDSFYNRLVPIIRERLCKDEDPLEVLTRNRIQVHNRLSRGSRQPPLRLDDLWKRLLSMLRRLTENPCGVKTIRRMYCRKHRGKDLRPPRIFSANGAFIRRSLKLLEGCGLVRSIPQGYHTSKSGKELLMEGL